MRLVESGNEQGFPGEKLKRNFLNKITWVGSVLVGDTRIGEVQHARMAEQLNHSVSRPNLEKFENKF